MTHHYDPEKHHRRSVRLPGYDYANSGKYFVTLVAYGRECLFGDVVNDVMRLNEYGRIIDGQWRRLPSRFPNTQLDTYIIMPNHFHGVISFDKTRHKNRTVGAPQRDAQNNGDIALLEPATLGAVIAQFKSAATKQIRSSGDIWHVWQRNYFEHIIRDDAELEKIRYYIALNPEKWGKDQYNPANDPANGR